MKLITCLTIMGTFISGSIETTQKTDFKKDVEHTIFPIIQAGSKQHFPKELCGIVCDYMSLGDEGKLIDLLRKSCGSREALEKFIFQDRGDINAQSMYSGKTALISFVQSGWANAHNYITLLLRYGADPNVQDNYGWTALMYAAQDNSLEKIITLLNAGANPYLKSYDEKTIAQLGRLYLKMEKYANKTFFDLASPEVAKDPEIKKVLDAYDKSQPHTKRDSLAIARKAVEEHMLDWAREYHNLGEEEKLKRWLSYGADINAQNGQGRTALMQAVLAGNEHLAKLLIEKGADLNRQDADGLTALMFTAAKTAGISGPGVAYSRRTIAVMLLNAGANPHIKTYSAEKIRGSHKGARESFVLTWARKNFFDIFSCILKDKLLYPNVANYDILLLEKIKKALADSEARNTEYQAKLASTIQQSMNENFPVVLTPLIGEYLKGNIPPISKIKEELDRYDCREEKKSLE